MIDWYRMDRNVPDEGKPCIIKSYKNNFYIATYQLFGRIGRWITIDNRIVDMGITHWAYITPPNND